MKILRSRILFTTILIGLFALSAFPQDGQMGIMRLTEAEIAEFAGHHVMAPVMSPSWRVDIPERDSIDLISHLSYIPAEQNQGGCGNCWAWAGTGVLAIAMDFQLGIKQRLSIQYLSDCLNNVLPAKTCCSGGNLNNFSTFYRTAPYKQAVPWSNTNADWKNGDGSCHGTCGSISTDPKFPISGIQYYRITTTGISNQQAITNIKSILYDNKAIWFAFFLGNRDDWKNFKDFWRNQDESAVWNPNYSCGHLYDPDNGAGGHAVLCTGFNDEDPSNPYWIMLNSWGTAGGKRPHGTFRVSMNMNYDCQLSTKSGGFLNSFTWQTLDVSFTE